MTKKQATASEIPPAAAIDAAILTERLKGERGGRVPETQIKVLSHLLELAGDGQEIERPNLKKIGSAVGLSRQCVANALTRLRQRQLIEERKMTIPIVHRHKTVRFIVPHLPGEPAQMMLPFDAEAVA